MIVLLRCRSRGGVGYRANHAVAVAGRIRSVVSAAVTMDASTSTCSSSSFSCGKDRNTAIIRHPFSTTTIPHRIEQQYRRSSPSPTITACSNIRTFRTSAVTSEAASSASTDSTDSIDSSADDAAITTNAYQSLRRTMVRNVAVIAHVDHGKTTLVDQMLKSGFGTSDTLDNERLMDSGDLEKERGITITSKVTRILHQARTNPAETATTTAANSDDEIITINVADTPGHSDFSGEVDRFLSLSDGFILVVDAAEGPKSQTKYVLSRALALQLQPIVVLNKCDRPDAIARIDSGETEQKLQQLFRQLIPSDRPVPDYLTLYASAREGWITDDPLSALELTETGLTDPNTYGMKRLLDHILQQIPEPAVRLYDTVDNDDPDNGTSTISFDGTYFGNDKFSMAAVTVGNDKYLGRTCTGRITSGSIAVSDNVIVLPRNYAPPTTSDGTTSSNSNSSESSSKISAPSAISGVFTYKGISRMPYEERAYAGDIVTLAGVPDSIAVGDTITGASSPIDVPIQTPPLAPPTLCMDFGANDGPLAGKEGTIVASAKIRDRLLYETDNNVTLKVEISQTDSEKTVVYARGELQLGILIEQMRREGFEMIVSPPRILTRKCEKTGKTLEPYEEVVIDVDSEYAGAVISSLTGDRRGVLLEMSESSGDGKSQLVLEVPSRGLLGFNSEIATATKGSAVVNHLYIEDRFEQTLGVGLVKGKLVSNDTGKATGYSLTSLLPRGTLFIEPSENIYAGMVIGENTKPGDLEVNAVRAKEKTNMRTHSKDEKVNLPPPKRMSVEELIGYMGTDEVIEITPKSIRLRKQLLDSGERERAARTKMKQIKSMSGK